MNGGDLSRGHAEWRQWEGIGKSSTFFFFFNSMKSSTWVVTVQANRLSTTGPPNIVGRREVRPPGLGSPCVGRLYFIDGTPYGFKSFNLVIWSWLVVLKRERHKIVAPVDGYQVRRDERKNSRMCAVILFLLATDATDTTNIRNNSLYSWGNLSRLT